MSYIANVGSAANSTQRSGSKADQWGRTMRNPQQPDWTQAMQRAQRLEHCVTRLPSVHSYALGCELRRSTQLIQLGVLRCARTASPDELEPELKQLVLAVEQLQAQFVQARQIRDFLGSQTLSVAADSAQALSMQSAVWLQQSRSTSSARPSHGDPCG